MTINVYYTIVIFLIFFCHAIAAPASAATYRIMPLGDSNTRGVAGSSNDTGYRRSLYLSLTAAGYSVDFVGSQVDGIPNDFDKNHEGHGGFRDDQVADNVYDWLTANPADIILLHIGTNGVEESASDLEVILDEIDSFETDNGVTIWVILALIINRNCITDEPPCAESVTTTNFNNIVAAMAQSRIDLLGDNIFVVDMENGAIFDYHLFTDNPPGDMADNLHPFDTGYEKMADVWYYAIQQILDPHASLSYTAITPCKIVDTRNMSGGIINAFTARNFHVFGSAAAISAQGGNAAGCPSPAGEPLAAHINLIAVNPTGKGNLQAFPKGAGPGAGLSVNYNTIDTNLANAGNVGTVTGAGPDITVTSRFSDAHAVLSVAGYYYSMGDLLYTPITPCKIVDTRNTTAGIIGAFAQRNYHVFGSAATISAQGGNAAGCPSPAGEPLAAHINLIAVDPTSKGNLQAYPLGAGPGAGLSVNYNTIDTNLANAGNVGTVTGAGPDITVTSRFSDAHAVLSVAGYYYPMGNLRYTPITPCRIVDTRNTAAGIIGAFAQRNYHVFGSAATISAQGGNAAGCPSPAGEPLAAHINLIAVDPTGKGNLQAFPLGAGPGAGLSVNYNTIDTNLANAGNVGTVTGTGPDITVTSRFSSAHAVISLLGYYY